MAWDIQHLAAVAALSSPPSRKTSSGVGLLGYVDARSTVLGAPRQFTEQQEYDRVIRVLLDAIGAAELADLMSTGGAMTEDQALEAARSF